MEERTRQLVDDAYRTHHEALVRHVAAIIRDRELAEDIAHEAFVRLLRAVDEGRQPDNIGAWLHRVGTNLAASHGRHVQVVNRHAQTLPRPADAPDPEATAVQDELSELVAAMLTELPRAERDALVMAAYGVGGSEIAASVGRTAGATRTMLCRARNRIRRQLATAGYAPA